MLECKMYLRIKLTDSAQNISGCGEWTDETKAIDIFILSYTHSHIHSLSITVLAYYLALGTCVIVSLTKTS